MKSQVLWTIGGLLVFTGCATMSEDELLDSGMIPPSANYSPVQAPVYPPLNQPYSPNLMNGNDSRVMNIDRINVGEANLPAPQPNAPQNSAQPSAQNGADDGNFETYDEYTSDYTQEYVPSYIAPSEVVPYEQVLPSPNGAIQQGGQYGMTNGANPSVNPQANFQANQAPSTNLNINPQAIAPQANQANIGANQPTNASCYYEPCLQATPPMTMEQPLPPTAPLPPAMPKQPAVAEPKAPNIIPNSPLLESENVIELSAVGMGVAPESTISPSQALALAKRAAIIDAYRQIGEKMYGIKINGKDTVKDMILTNSVVKARVDALIKNADIVETIYKDGLCQVTMELKLDGRTWSRILASN